MGQINKMFKQQSLRFRCGGYTKLNGDTLSPGIDPEKTAILILEGDALVPCYESAILSLGVKGKIVIKHLRRDLERAGWLLALIDPEQAGENISALDPLCPRHGAILASGLIQEPGTPAHVVKQLEGYLQRAAAAMQATNASKSLQ